MSDTNTTSGHDQEPRHAGLAIARGARKRCPACGKGALFKGYVKVAPTCPSCGEELHHQRADDAPAYFTIFIVGHIAVGGVLWTERAYQPDSWVQAAIWITIAVGMSLWMLPAASGAWAPMRTGQARTSFSPAV